jgi:hypothetical protein
MPITVACSCGAKLRAPDAAAGKRVKCPKCGSPVPVPAADADFEVIDDPPPPPVKKMPTVAAAVKRKPEPVEVNEAVDEDDEDEKPKKKKPRRERDEDDEDEKPKKKGKRRVGKNREEEKKKRTIRLILGIVGAVVVLGVMVGVIMAVLHVINNDPAKAGLPAQPTQPKVATPPTGWKTFKAGGMSVWIPESVTLTERVPEPGEKNPAVTASKSWTNFDPKNPPQGAVAIYEIGRGQLEPAFADKFRQDPTAAWDELLKKANAGAAAGVNITATDDTLGGERGKQIVIRLPNDVRVTSRSVVKGGEMYTASVLSRGAGEDDPAVKNFFDGFRFE